MFNGGYVLVFEIAVLLNPISARFCEEGYICSSPKECCQEGCCYAAPRTPPATTDHVFKLFFYNHWYFWCVMFAIILAILCACSLWRKRRQLCGWGSPGPHSQSGDSAGSCYAPPQYSRCTSFHHAPPPYTEVTSKPDLYPLVFTCNSDNGKNGASYVMVQYFRNYIVRPAGSLSATSTVDSLSSSFICTANEANTLIPPPYSRAASPDLPINASASSITPTATSNAYATMPRSASQHAYSLENHTHNKNNNNSIVNINNNNNFNKNNQYNFHHLTYQQHNNPHHSSYRPVSLYARNETVTNNYYNNNNQMRLSESVNFQNIRLNKLENSHNNTVILSQSDQQFRYILNNNNNNQTNENNNNTENSVSNSCNNINENNINNNMINLSFPTNNNCDIATNNQSINQTNINNNNNKCAQNTNDNNNNNSKNGKNTIYNSCGSSIEAISITVPVVPPATDCERDYKDLDMLRRSLETCCQILQKQQQHNQNQKITIVEQSLATGSGTSPPPPPPNSIGSQNYNQNANSYSISDGGGTQQMSCNIDDCRLKKFDSYVNSTTCSAVSSLLNIESAPGSPPQATSPTTGEVKELLEQIRQLQQSDNINQSNESMVNEASISSSPQPQLLQSPSTNPSTSFKSMHQASTAPQLKRPSTLQNRKELFSKSKTRYFPILPSSSPHTKSIRSPIGFIGNSIMGGGAGSFGGGSNSSSGNMNFNLLTKNRSRKGWISRSAPTTPGTGLPPTCFLDDNSPLLNEHDEDAEQNA